jgi:hypothetical protein
MVWPMLEVESIQTTALGTFLSPLGSKVPHILWKMLNRYPDQVSRRKGFALVGGAIIAFGLVAALIELFLVAGIIFSMGLALLLPSIFFEHSAFARAEKILSTIFVGW